MTSKELAISMLNGRTSAWLSVKQTRFLADLITREHRNPRPGRVLYLSLPCDDSPYEDGLVSYQLAIAPNGAGLLKPVQ